ncbi:MAG: glycosyltransferase family 4 protein [Nitrososphaera sp.]|nr:glycosyltransferase family 4 protein [Nitrososphaera sp.]
MGKRLRVALMLTPVDFGGSERVCLTLLKNIDCQRFNLYPILLTRPWEQDNVFVRELRKAGYNYSKVPVALRPQGDFLRVARCYKIVYKIIRGQSFDLLHTHGYFANIVGIPIAKTLGLPCVSTCHGYITNDWKLAMYNALDLVALRFATTVIAVSEGIRAQLVKRGLKDNRILVIPNAANNAHSQRSAQTKLKEELRSRLTIGKEEFILGYLGRLSEEKGLRHLLTASSQLTEKGLSLRTLIVGDGPQRSELELLAQDLKIRERVIFAGFQEDIHRWLLCMDAFILPSLTEGTPMALLEAMAQGVPVIATAVGGVPEVIESGESGILVSAGKPEAIAEAVLALYRDELTRNRIAENACYLIKTKYGIRPWMNRIERAYSDLLT